MFNKLFQNTRKPQGFLGRLILAMMNTGHSKMACWGFSQMELQDHSHILDVGCGGGANISKMLKEFPNSMVTGLDYSEDSVTFSRRKNAAHLGTRCDIRQGDVACLPYPNQSFHYVTAFETIYFWPDLTAAFAEIKRVLKPEGTFNICCDSDDSENTTWTSRIEGMTIYQSDDLKHRLLDAGFKSVKIHRNKRGWICLNATC